MAPEVATATLCNPLEDLWRRPSPRLRTATSSAIINAFSLAL